MIFNKSYTTVRCYNPLLKMNRRKQISLKIKTDISRYSLICISGLGVLLFLEFVPFGVKALIFGSFCILSAIYPTVGFFTIATTQVIPDIFYSSNVGNFEVLTPFLILSIIRWYKPMVIISEKIGIGSKTLIIYFLWTVIIYIVKDNFRLIIQTSSILIIFLYTTLAFYRANNENIIKEYMFALGIGLLILAVTYYLWKIGFGIVSQGRMADLNELVIMRQGVQRLAFGRGDFNFVAGAMIFGLSMVLFSMSTKNIWIQAALIFFCAYPVLSTMSRMGIIMYISTAFFWMVWLFKQRKISFHLPLVFMATIIAVIYINYEYFEAFRDALRYSALSGYESRSDTFGFLFYKILNNPLLGLQQDYGYKIYAHNAFLEFAMSVGLPGLFLICFWIFYPFLYVKTMYVKHSAWPYFVMTVLGMMMFSLSCSGFKTIFVFVGICYCSITEKDTRIRS